MPTMSCLRRCFAAALAALVAAWPAPPAQAEEQAPLLWQLGKPDGSGAEFALAPAAYRDFKEDGFFIVGQSDPRRDWPYIHPGPADDWAGTRPHTFTIAFGLKSAPKAGTCTLSVALVDTQNRTPPKLRVEINAKTFDRQMPPGAGDESAFGELIEQSKQAGEGGRPEELLPGKLVFYPFQSGRGLL